MDIYLSVFGKSGFSCEYADTVQLYIKNLHVSSMILQMTISHLTAPVLNNYLCYKTLFSEIIALNVHGIRRGFSSTQRN